VGAFWLIADPQTRQIGSRHHSYVIDSKDPHVKVWVGEVDGYCGRNKGPEDVDGKGNFAGASPHDSKEVEGMKACPRQVLVLTRCGKFVGSFDTL